MARSCECFCHLIVIVRYFIIQIFGLTLPIIWNEELFPEPHVFKPERHLDCNGEFVKNEYLTPFGVGKQKCLN